MKHYPASAPDIAQGNESKPAAPVKTQRVSVGPAGLC